MNEDANARRVFRAMGVTTDEQLAEFLAKEAAELGHDQDVDLAEIPGPEMLTDAEIDAAIIAGLRESFAPGPE